MKSKFDCYIDMVISKIGCSHKLEKQIREDLYNTLLEKQNLEGIDDPYKLMGDPADVAEDFKENLDMKDTQSYESYRAYDYEYISKARILGIPLVHINFKRFGVAKGIIAIGGISIGVLSIGGISIGIISLGGAALGILCTLGGVAVSIGISIGGLAVAYLLSFGGLAIAKYMAFGGLAIADISVGGVAKGIVAVYEQSGTGKYLFKAPADPNEVIRAVKNIYPNINNIALKILKYIISLATNK